MQCLSLAQVKAILYKLLVFSENGAFYYPVATIYIIIKQRMPTVLHVDADLMGPTGFQAAFNQAYILQVFQNGIMGDGFLATVSIWENIHELPEAGMPANVTSYCTRSFLEISPDQGRIPSLYGMFKKLTRQFDCCKL